jgi:hypothetical protein
MFRGELDGELHRRACFSFLHDRLYCILGCLTHQYHRRRSVHDISTHLTGFGKCTAGRLPVEVRCALGVGGGSDSWRRHCRKYWQFRSTCQSRVASHLFCFPFSCPLYPCYLSCREGVEADDERNKCERAVSVHSFFCRDGRRGTLRRSRPT